MRRAVSTNPDFFLVQSDGTPVADIQAIETDEDAQQPCPMDERWIPQLADTAPRVQLRVACTGGREDEGSRNIPRATLHDKRGESCWHALDVSS